MASTTGKSEGTPKRERKRNDREKRRWRILLEKHRSLNNLLEIEIERKTINGTNKEVFIWDQHKKTKKSS